MKIQRKYGKIPKKYIVILVDVNARIGEEYMNNRAIK